MLDVYFNNINEFDIGVLIFGALFLLAQIFTFIYLKKLKNRIKNSDDKVSEEDLKHSFSWVQGANILKEMIALLPFAGLLGTVIGLLNTLSSFRIGSEVGDMINKFAPALTSTVSALIGTIVNVFIFNMLLLPFLIENEDISSKPIINKKTKK